MPAAREALTAFFAGRTAQTAVVAERAISRGELPEDTETVEVIRALAATFYYRMFITGEPVDRDVADRGNCEAPSIASRSSAR
jgi:hypothetical protein